MSSRIVLGAFGSIAVAMAGSAGAANIDFQNASNTNWFDTANWYTNASPGVAHNGIPTSADVVRTIRSWDVVINSGNAVAASVTVGNSKTGVATGNGSLFQVSGTGTLTTSGNLTINGANNASRFVVGSGGVVSIGGAQAGNAGNSIELSGNASLTIGGSAGGGTVHKITGSQVDYEQGTLSTAGGDKFDFGSVTANNNTPFTGFFTADVGGFSTLVIDAFNRASNVNNTNPNAAVNLTLDFTAIAGSLTSGQEFTLFNGAAGLATFDDNIANDTLTPIGLPAGWTASYVYDTTNNDLKVQVVPEPTALTVLGLGVLALGARRRRV